MRRLIFLIVLVLIGCNSGNPRQDRVLESTKLSTPKILVIGFDGATWKTIDNALEKNMMPTLDRLIKSGVRAPFKTIRPTLTPVIWTSIATGKKPSKHGVTGIFVENPETGLKEPINSRLIKVKTLWQILSEENTESSIVRWPVTWPVSRFNGTMVSEFAFQSSRKQTIFPEDLSMLLEHKRPEVSLADIESLTGVNLNIYNLLDPQWQWKLFVLLREYSLDIHFKEIALSLLKTEQKPFSAVYFYSMDALGHSFFKFSSTDLYDKTAEPDFSGILNNWCWLYDQFLMQLLEVIDPNTYIMIMSDHGMNPALKPQNFLIRSQDDPPSPGDDDLVTIKPGPAFDTDPFSMPLQYTYPSGQHNDAPDGIFVLTGPGVKTGIQIPELSVLDIAPTILYMMNLPVARDFDGVVRQELFQEKFNAKRTISYVDTYETGAKYPKPNIRSDDYTTENELLINRLEALGYIK